MGTVIWHPVAYMIVLSWTLQIEAGLLVVDVINTLRSSVITVGGTGSDRSLIDD